MGDEMLSHLIKAALVLRGQEKQLQTMKDNILEAETYAEELEAKLAKAVEALDEAVYLLAPDEKDMMRQAGVYRVVTTLAELKGETDE